jgi:hypothetical protein
LNDNRNYAEPDIVISDDDATLKKLEESKKTSLAKVNVSNEEESDESEGIFLLI